MIVIDTSAVFAILLSEPMAARCRAIVETDEFLAMSAGTAAEIRIVAAGKGVSAQLDDFLSRLILDIVPATAESAVAVGDAYRRWGKGFHEAKLNFGDCFAYALAQERACPLLYVGRDFALTDVRSALT